MRRGFDEEFREVHVTSAPGATSLLIAVAFMAIAFCLGFLF